MLFTTKDKKSSSLASLIQSIYFVPVVKLSVTVLAILALLLLVLVFTGILLASTQEIALVLMLVISFSGFLFVLLYLYPIYKKQRTSFKAHNSQNSTLNALNDVVIRTDETGKILYINQSFEKLFAISGEHFVNQRYVKVKTSILMADITENYEDILLEIQTKKNPDRVFKQVISIKLNQKLLSIEQDVKGIFSSEGTFKGTVIVLRDVTSAEKLRARLHYQANFDSVTKLFNRYKFEQRLVDAWHDAQENKHQHALLQLDMDRFKLINDNAGHAAGDQLLRDIGQLLKSEVRQSDICARIGGDEFSVLLLKVTKENALMIMQKINRAIKELTFSYSGQVFDVGASIGATLINHESPPLVEVKREADAACFMAKNQGINCYQLFDSRDENVVHHHQETRWAARIQTALEQDQFELFFQEIKSLSIEAGEKQHIEILLRLRDKEQLLSPNVFLPAVERFRLSAEVDYWVMSKTFAWLANKPQLWQKLVIAINLSGDSLTDESFIDSIIACQKNYQFPCSAICFEITETAAIANMSMATKMVEKLRFSGFAIALDDFGKGFSTFSYLKNLPAKYIKIDGSYIQNILHNKYDVAIVKSIQSMASTLNMLTIAEFVQCEQSTALLQAMGIDFVQGFGIAYPAPLDEFICSSESDQVIPLKVG